MTILIYIIVFGIYQSLAIEFDTHYQVGGTLAYPSVENVGLMSLVDIESFNVTTIWNSNDFYLETSTVTGDSYNISASISNWGNFHVILSLEKEFSIQNEWIDNFGYYSVQNTNEGKLSIDFEFFNNYNLAHFVNVDVVVFNAVGPGTLCLRNSNLETWFFSNGGCAVLENSIFETEWFYAENIICFSGDYSAFRIVNRYGNYFRVAGFGMPHSYINIISYGEYQHSYESGSLNITFDSGQIFSLDIGPGYDESNFTFNNTENEIRIGYNSNLEPGMGNECPCSCDFEELPQSAPRVGESYTSLTPVLEESTEAIKIGTYFQSGGEFEYAGVEINGLLSLINPDSIRLRQLWNHKDFYVEYTAALDFIYYYVVVVINSGNIHFIMSTQNDNPISTGYLINYGYFTVQNTKDKELAFLTTYFYNNDTAYFFNTLSRWDEVYNTGVICSTGNSFEPRAYKGEGGCLVLDHSIFDSPSVEGDCFFCFSGEYSEIIVDSIIGDPLQLAGFGSPNSYIRITQVGSFDSSYESKVLSITFESGNIFEFDIGAGYDSSKFVFNRTEEQLSIGYSSNLEPGVGNECPCLCDRIIPQSAPIEYPSAESSEADNDSEQSTESVDSLESTKDLHWESSITDGVESSGSSETSIAESTTAELVTPVPPIGVSSEPSVTLSDQTNRQSVVEVSRVDELSVKTPARTFTLTTNIADDYVSGDSDQGTVIQSTIFDTSAVSESSDSLAAIADPDEGGVCRLSNGIISVVIITIFEVLVLYV
ncbi:uncharacterized protein J8A68_004217 [[Candida] subhashii]|uniref:Hyphally-regulated cell wall protein N-terminal domain-containing protein n=1 Tax=[Candida] subhashii TaxID=561895 RepID=A0A8J5QHR3_9ASCO|nr:uncharacterized protein J8A68_004217 [[Candida] subhashii]KAG7662323.1 hypothetical protein J8A68_004217 [[Candida] subhashii]